MIRNAFIFMAAAAAITLVELAAEAVPGEMCQHQNECSAREICVADSETSNTGHCARIRVLP